MTVLRPFALSVAALALLCAPISAQDQIFSEVTGTDGDWLVFVHGAFSDYQDWDGQVEALRDEYRVLVVDLRGHGRSNAMAGPYDIPTLGSDVARVLEARRVEDAILIGNGMATRVVVEALHAAPERVAGIVFLDGTAWAEGDPEAGRQAILDQIDSMGLEQMWQSATAGIWSGRTDPGFRDAFMAKSTLTFTRIGRELLPNSVYYDGALMNARYAEIDVPVLAVATTTTGELGSGRRPLRPEEQTSSYLDRMRGLVPHLQTSTIPGTGHIVQVEAVDETNQAIRDFVTQVFQ